MARPKKQIKAKEPVRIRFKELNNGNKSIYLDIYRNGKRSYEFLKLYLVPEIDAASRALNEHNLALANKIKADRIIELTNNEKGVTNSALRSKTRIVDLLEMYKKSLVEQGKHSSAVNVDSVIKSITSFRGDGVTLRQLDTEYCLGYINHLRSDYKTKDDHLLSASTANGYITIFSAAINMAIRRDYLRENPFSKISPADKIKKPESKRSFLRIEDLKKLIATDCPIRPQVKQAFLFACYTGIRRGDILALTWDKITKDGEQWRLTTVMEKTDEPLYQPLSAQAVRWLPERGDAADSDLVFNDLPSVMRIAKILQLWVDAAEVKKHVTFHMSRHTFATMMLTLDVDLYTTSKLLGHKNIATTQIYAKIIDQKKTDAVNRVNDIFKD